MDAGSYDNFGQNNNNSQNPNNQNNNINQNTNNQNATNGQNTNNQNANNGQNTNNQNATNDQNTNNQNATNDQNTNNQNANNGQNTNNQNATNDQNTNNQNATNDQNTNNQNANNGQNTNNQNNNIDQNTNSQNNNIDQNINHQDNNHDVKMEETGFGSMLNSYPPAPASDTTNNGPWGRETARILESTPFPQPQGGDENYDTITLPRDPDVKERKVAVTGTIYGILAFRSLLLVLLPSRSTETHLSRAVLVKSSDAGMAKQRFLNGGDPATQKILHASDGADLVGCDWEDFDPILVAVDASKSVTYCIGRVKGDEHKNLYSKSTLDAKLGGQKNVDKILNTHRGKVGQGPIPRKKRATGQNSGENEAHQEYVRKHYAKWGGVAPPVLPLPPLPQEA
ncbi:hypothetical protein F5Y16DRAFT_422461 [Xylariaceae sp. FL0255]|nr:hypothetical protein F5Y16DRAFT_422461 [Xylariaceae sp. FL0255]